MPIVPTAIVYLADSESLQGALSEVAGLRVIERLIFTAARAGVREIYLPPALSQALTPNRSNEIGRAGISIRGLSNLSDEEHQRLTQAPLLLLPAHLVIDPASIERLGRAGVNSHSISLEETKGSTAPILLAEPLLTGRLWARLARGRPIGEELESELRQGSVRLIAGGGFAVAVTDRASALRAEARVYQSLGTSADGWVDRALNRRFSLFLTRLLVGWPITPNQVSLLSLAVGLGAAYGFWNASPFSASIGVVLYALAVVLDHTDGEIARLKFLESPLGKWLDFSIDTLIHAALVLGIGMTASRWSGLLGVGLSIAAAAGIVMSAVVAQVGKIRPGATGPTGDLLSRMANRDLFYVVVLASVGMLFFAPALLPWLTGVLAMGSQAYWLGALIRQRQTAR